MHVILIQQAINMRERIETPIVLWEEHNVRLQQGNGDVPRIVRLPEVPNHLRGYLRLRLAQRYALQQRLHNIRAMALLSLMVLFAQERYQRLREMHLFLLVKSRPHNGEDEHPHAVRHKRVRMCKLSERSRQR